MSKSNCEPALLSSLETLQHNLQDAGMLRDVLRLLEAK